MNKAGEISTESLNSSQESHVRFPGETSNEGRQFSVTLNQERSVQNRQQQLRKSFLKEVSEHLSKVGTVIIMGPAETKYELYKELERKKIFSTARMEVKSADKM